MLKHWTAIAFASFACLPARGAGEPFSELSGETSVSVGYGYAENVLYSELAPLGSAFALARLEGVGDLPAFSELVKWKSMLFAEHRRYFSEEEIPDQSLVLAQSELEGYVGLYGKWRLGGRFLGMEQAFDLTFDALERTSVSVKAQEPEAFIGWDSFFWIFAYEAEIGLSRMSFEQPGNDYDSFNWQLSPRFPIGEGLAWEFEVSGYERDYLDRLGRDLTGYSLEGTVLGMSELGYETGLVWSADTERADHRVSLTLGERDRDDSISGYYARRRRSVDIAYHGQWRNTSLLLEIDYGRYLYGVQIGDDGLAQRNDSWSWSVEFERELSERWGGFVALSGEIEESNLGFSSYESRSLAVGLKWLR